MNDDDHDLSLSEMSSKPKTIYKMGTFDSMPQSDGISSLASPILTPPEEETKVEYHEYEPETITLDEPKPSLLDRLLDFNPCTIKISNPASALFKIRTCAECGDRVHKFRNGGYQKEEHLIEEQLTIFDDEAEDEDESGVVAQANSFDSTASSKIVKAYYHGDCMKLKEDRAAHKDVFGTVLLELIDAIETRERQRREAEERLAEEEERMQRAEEEAAAAAAVAQAAALAKEAARSPLKKRAKKFFRSFKSCRGASNSTAATDESAFRGAEI